MIDTVSSTYNCDWDKACKLNVNEFLNVYSYHIAKTRREIEIQKEAYNKMKAKSRIRH